MSDGLYERYKDALRRGHVGRAARDGSTKPSPPTREAAAIAPDRAMPHAGLGAASSPAGRLAEALAAYDRGARARSRATRPRCAAGPRCSRSRADAVDAAETLDRLAAVLDRDGPAADACDAARRALELAESRGRRRAASRRSSQRLRGRRRPRSGERPRPSRGSSRSRRGHPRAARAPAEPKRDPRRSVMPAEPAVALDGCAPRPRSMPATSTRPAAAASRPAPAHRVDRPTSTRRSTPATRPWPSSPADRRRPPVPRRALPRTGLARPAADKLVLLGRLAELTGDTRRAARLCYRRPRDASPTTRGWRRVCALTPRRPAGAGRPAGRCYTRRTMPRSSRSILEQVRLNTMHRHRDHRAPDLLAVQPDPRDARRPPRHRRQRAVRRLRPGRRLRPRGC